MSQRSNEYNALDLKTELSLSPSITLPFLHLQLTTNEGGELAAAPTEGGMNDITVNVYVRDHADGQEYNVDSDGAPEVLVAADDGFESTPNVPTAPTDPEIAGFVVAPIPGIFEFGDDITLSALVAGEGQAASDLDRRGLDDLE